MLEIRGYCADPEWQATYLLGFFAISASSLIVQTALAG